MKSLLLALTFIFSLGLGATAQAEELPPSETPTNFWAVQIFSPVVSQSKQKLNVEYKVLSIHESDNKFDVKLLQNGTQIATDSITHAYGNSGVFSITLPASGTYSYQVSATITAESPRNGQSKSSETVNAKVIDGTVTNTIPAPATTTTTTNGSNANGSGAGQTNGTTSNGKVTDNAAKTSDKAGSSLGSKTTKDSGDKKWYAIGAALLIVLAGGYYWFVYRKAGELE